MIRWDTGNVDNVENWWQPSILINATNNNGVTIVVIDNLKNNVNNTSKINTIYSTNTDNDKTI